MKNKADKWTWQDDYRVEIAGKPFSEVEALLNFHDGQRLPSERTMECALMLRSEIHRRMTALQGVL